MMLLYHKLFILWPNLFRPGFVSTWVKGSPAHQLNTKPARWMKRRIVSILVVRLHFLKRLISTFWSGYHGLQWCVSLPVELYFLIARFLEATPCKGAAKVCWSILHSVSPTLCILLYPVTLFTLLLFPQVLIEELEEKEVSCCSFVPEGGLCGHTLLLELAILRPLHTPSATTVAFLHFYCTGRFNTHAHGFKGKRVATVLVCAFRACFKTFSPSLATAEEQELVGRREMFELSGSGE